MSETRPIQKEPVPSDTVRAKAAAWVARLHEERSPDVDAGVRAWLRESEDHRRAFNRMTRVWELTGKMQMRAGGDMSAARPGPRSRVTPWAATMAATLLLAVLAAAYFWRDNTVVTGVGQRQVRLLKDGTRVLLNTDTRIELNFDEHARRVRLVRGEARFDVAKHAAWPFLVTVDGQEIRALGTSFIVRNDAQDLSVTLVEGQISVAPIARNGEAASQNAQILAPGQRLTISRHHAPAVDRPELNRVMAWEHGRVEFEETPLGDAANEMNRYATTHIIVADPDVAQLRIGGVFRAGDSDEFVGTVAAAFGLQADRRGSNIELSRPSVALVPPSVP